MPEQNIQHVYEQCRDIRQSIFSAINRACFDRDFQPGGFWHTVADVSGISNLLLFSGDAGQY